MASAALVIECARRKSSRVTNRRLRPLEPDVTRARAVARLTLHAVLPRNNLVVCRQTERARRVALKAPQDRGGRIKGSVSLARRRRMARRQILPIELRVETEPVFEIGLIIDAANGSHRLCARAELPRAIRRARQRPRMTGLAMRGKLIRMTSPARARANVARWRLRESEQDGCYQMNRPLN